MKTKQLPSKFQIRFNREAMSAYAARLGVPYEAAVFFIKRMYPAVYKDFRFEADAELVLNLLPPRIRAVVYVKPIYATYF